MKKSLLLILLSSFIIQGCVSTTEQLSKEDQEIPFTITKAVGANGSFILLGNMIDCDIKWEAYRGILTHRSSCKDALKEDVLKLMISMASKFKEKSPIKVDFIRFTSKDFRDEENRLAKMMTQSKVWNRFSVKYKSSKKNKNLKKDFQNNFLKKVFEKKKVFALVPVAFKKVGYKFEFDQIEVTKMKAAKKSRHRNQLVEGFKPKSSLLIPEDIKVVLKRSF